MKKIIISLLASSIVSSAYAVPSLPTQQGMDFLYDQNQGEIIINNRVLLRFNKKTITVLDVAKKMDLIFYRQFPQLAASSMARYQFYLANFRAMVKNVIQDELILADAEEKKVTVSDGDVREELEELFGPDVVINVNKTGISYEEVWNLLRDEIKVKRMNGGMVRARALNEVNPKAIHDYYEEFVKTHPPDKQWNYRLVTIRGEEEDLVKMHGMAVRHFLTEEGHSWEEIETAFSEIPSNIRISVSEEFQRKEKDMSEAHRKVLLSIKSGEVSPLILPEGTKSKEIAARLFILRETVELNPPSFDEMKEQIRGELTQKAIAKYGAMYLDKLEKHYGITQEYIAERIPDSFQPFAMR